LRASFSSWHQQDLSLAIGSDRTGPGAKPGCRCPSGGSINDSPALQEADVGIALNVRVDAAARDVADLGPARGDDLCSIVSASPYGRGTYENVRRALRFLLGTASLPQWKKLQ
jgi:hypothetical protein